MAKSPGGPFSPQSGKISNLIFYTVDGQQLTRAKGDTGKKSKSEGAVSNRRGFGNKQLWLNPLKPVIDLGFRNDKPFRGPMAYAISYMCAHAVTGKGAVAEIHPEKMKISVGSLEIPSTASVSITEGELVFQWDPKVAGRDGNGFDQVLLAAYNIGQGLAECHYKGIFRKDGLAAIPLTTPGEYHCYLGFIADDRTRQSDSIYLGTVSI